MRQEAVTFRKSFIVYLIFEGLVFHMGPLIDV